MKGYGYQGDTGQELTMMTVLVVIRQEGAIAWLKSYLETAGFRVVSARDGTAALDLARREPPALILLDLMPQAGCSNDDAGGAERCPEVPPEHDEGLVEGMDGCEFLRRLRRESNVGVIVLSRCDDEAIKVAALESGADDYLTRPFNPSELLARMHAVLRRVERYKRTTPDTDIDEQTLLGTAT
jgi:DNA-binding response OmpR family regulator